MQEAVDKNTFSQRLGLYLTGSFAGLAVIMVIAGLYGVLAQLVSYRRREIGVRMALGATRESIAKMVLRQGGMLIGIGLIAGLVLAAFTGQIVKSFLYNVKPIDIVTYCGVALLLLIVGSIASVIPAHTASTIEPMEALRED
jgi:putative ABC transport system permease protein